MDLVGLFIVAATTAGLAARFGLSAPLLLTGLGLVLSFVPGVPSFALEPDIILLGILPPLLYATAIRTPLVDIRRNRRSIGLLSVGLVLATAFAVAGVVALVLPEVPFAVALALGAVVAPPDAVAASAVARRVRMPRSVVTLLEGESLLNDATALVTLRTALAAAAGSVSLAGAAGDFARAVLVGAVGGVVVAEVVSWARRRVTDPVLDTALSLFAPYVAYLAAEGLHGSGVLGVVVAGLILGHRSPEIQSAASRVTERILWRTVQFLLESAVFLLIGLQLKELLTAVGEGETVLLRVGLLCAGVLLTVVAVRGLWVFPGAYLPRLVPVIARTEHRPAPREVALVAWAGMRGVVTLAAVLTIPEDVPGYPALVLAAFAVVSGTLLLQGPTLPWLVHRLGVRGPDPAQDALQEALVQHRAASAALDRLEAEGRDSGRPEVVAGLRGWGERVANAAWERLGTAGAARDTPAEVFHRLRLEMLDAERQVLTEVRRSGSVPWDVVERVMERVDQEEAMLEGFSMGAGSETEGSPEAASPSGPAACEHLAAVRGPVSPESAPDACPDCLAIGERSWVHLRMCLDCGHIGCCDSSPNRHSHAHFVASGHPVMRSVELGESWRWCWVDGELG
jgi:CPA1 family monovalent cation:H+ antiporter